MYKSNWKKSFRKIPTKIEQKLSGMSDDNLVVACVRKVPASVLADGKYGHLGMSMRGDTPSFPERATPEPTFGRFSTWNVEGREVVRKDLPMVTKTYSIEAPDWGDWGNGSHEVSWDRDVYQRDFIPPKEADISIRLLATEPADDPVFIFRFSIEEVLDRQDTEFEADLFGKFESLTGECRGGRRIRCGCRRQRVSEDDLRVLGNPPARSTY